MPSPCDQLEESRQIEAAIIRLNSSYSDALLEKIAGQSRTDSILPAEATQIKGKLKTLNDTLSALLQKRQASAYAMLQHPAISAYLRDLRSLSLTSGFSKENEVYECRQFWYPVKVIAAQAAFLLPLLLTAICWNKWAIGRQQDTAILVSSHLVQCRKTTPAPAAQSPMPRVRAGTPGSRLSLQPLWHAGMILVPAAHEDTNLLVSIYRAPPLPYTGNSPLT